MQDDLQARLGSIAANLARIASFSANTKNWKTVQSMLEESEFFIEWTAPDAPLNMKAFLAELQIQLALWQLIWRQVYTDAEKRDNLSHLAKIWSQDILTLRK